MMTELFADVRRLEVEEHARAAREHGVAANTPHEGYALIKEESEEAEEEFRLLATRVTGFWFQVKNDAPAEEMIVTLVNIERAALLGACELIQTAAMARKAMAGLKKEQEEQNREKVSESDGESRNEA